MSGPLTREDVERLRRTMGEFRTSWAAGGYAEVGPDGLVWVFDGNDRPVMAMSRKTYEEMTRDRSKPEGKE